MAEYVAQFKCNQNQICVGVYAVKLTGNPENHFALCQTWKSDTINTPGFEWGAAYYKGIKSKHLIILK